LIAVAAVALAATYLIAFGSFETWARRYEAWQLGRLLVVSIAPAAVFGLYHWRKTMRFRRETAERERQVAKLEHEVSDLRRTNEALGRNEARYRGVVAGLPVALFAVDGEGVFTLSEGKGLDALGLESDKVVGRSIFEAYRDAPEIIENVHLALAGRAFGASVEVGGLAFETRYSPLREDGEFSGVLGVATDVTERKEAEEALKESQRRLSTLLSNAPAYLYRCRNEPEWSNEFVSDFAFELTGHTPQELTDGSVMFTDLIAEEDRDRVWEEVQAALYSRKGFELQYSIRRKDGEVRHVEERGRGVYGGGEVEAIEGVVYDVTERVRAEQALREAEERYRTLVEQIPAVTYIDRATDGTDESLYTSPQIEMMLGYTPEEWLEGYLWLQRLHPDDRERVLASDQKFEAGGEPFSEEYRLLAKDGRVVWVREEAVLVRDEAGEPLYWQGVILDVTERKEAEERLRTLANAAFEGIIIAERGKILEANEAYAQMLGYERSELIGKPVLEVVAPEHRDRVRQNILAGHEEPYEIVELKKDGTRIDVEVRGRAFTYGGRPVRVTAVRDVTERKAFERRLEHQAFHDALTGLPNRALVTDRLRQALVRAKRREDEVAVLFMDLDNFKVINDSLGHKAGDRLLVAVSKRIRSLLRPEDTVARLGGDEFILLLEDTDIQGAGRVAERISEQLKRPFSLGGRRLFVTASVGIATGGANRKYAADLLRDADLAMYRAKRSGKARHAVFEEAMNARALERLEMEHDLRRALERDELKVHYQPQMLLDANLQRNLRATGSTAIVSAKVSREPRVTGVEALVRWEHPERGLLLPGRFVPLAEETGLIVPVGAMVLEEACHQVKAWQGCFVADPPLAVSVNLSARQFREPDLTETVSRILRETGLDPTCLHLEITETTAMSDAPATVSTLEDLKALGVRLVIDDFGTGYSSLSYLQRFPVDYVKIDRSFVDGLEEDTGATALVSGMIDLAHALGIEVIAEGVQRLGQLERLGAMRCDLAQGSYFSGPLPSEALGTLLEDDAVG
jgi:diguanylate cyclase (GGDEF)-like protein/PAS domain S-box-containing protein